MNDAQKMDKLKRLADEIKVIHAEYLERFSKIKKKQIALSKEISGRIETEKISRLVKDIKNISTKK